MKKLINNILGWVFLFLIFVPYGYLPLYWAIPTSISCFLLFVNSIAEEYKRLKNLDK